MVEYDLTGRVTVIGDALIDEIVSDDGVREFVGGAALNVAVGLAILGVPTSLIAMVGDDPAGGTIRSFLALNGVKLIATPAPGGSARATSVRVNGEPTYAFNEAARARRIEINSEAMDAIAAAQLVVVSSFPFDDSEQTEQLRDAVESPELRLIIDVNPRQALIHDLEVFRRGFESMATVSLLVKLGDEDAALLYGSRPNHVAARLLAAGARAVFTTLGRWGAEILRSKGAVIAVPIAAMDGDIVDTMGAGDATLASVTASLLALPRNPSDAEWAIVLDRAMLVAAATCRVTGATLQQ
jgi:sugar/nucleoside kinase (ribokinase family)